MKAEDLMTTDVHTCCPTDSLEQACRAMWEHDVGCLVVTDAAGIPVGVITDRDVSMAAYTRGALLRDMQVASAMAKDVVVCSTSTPLRELEEVMRHRQLRRVPVVGHGQELVGIVSLGDLARSAASSSLHMTELPGLAKTLAAVTAPRAPRSPSVPQAAAAE